MYITKYLNSHSEINKGDQSYKFTHEVNGKKLANEIEKILNDFAKKNIELVSITPITSGIYESWSEGGMGYGITDGVIIIGKKDE